MLSVVGHLCAAVVFTRDLIINSKILYFTFSLSLSLSLCSLFSSRTPILLVSTTLQIRPWFPSVSRREVEEENKFDSYFSVAM